MSRLLWLVVPCLAAAATVSACAPAISGRTVERAAPAAMLADYDREIREAQPRADAIHHVDTPATVAKLREAHVTNYWYLVYHEATDWTDLVHEFLPAAQRAGIGVWVYLVPPSECCSRPYDRDFVRWAEEIARLSLRYPNLRGWAMDDFSSNLSTFTPQYTQRMRDAARRINRSLRFFPVLYRDNYSPDFLAAYAAHFDGAIFPYTSNFITVDGLDDELARITQRLEPFGLPLVLMIYATKISVAPYPPSAEYVAGALRVGLESMARGQIAGVTTYSMAKEFQQEDCRFARHLSLTVPSATPTSVGDFVSASQHVVVDPRARNYRVRFFEQDSYPVGTAGYHFKQLVVDGQVVWETDVAADAALAWTERAFDLTPHLAGKTHATLAFRLFDKKGVTNFGIRVSFAELESTGFVIENAEFTATTGWSFASQGPGATSYADQVCDPDRQRHVYESVRDLYAHYGGLRR
jgi:hypothetical protein